MRVSSLQGCRWAATLLLGFLAGCGPEFWGHKRPTSRPAGTLGDKSELTRPQSIAREGTIGAISYLEGVRLMRVKGFGLVTGLAGKGSSGCPSSVREALVKEVRRMRSANPARGDLLPDPNAMIDSLDTAVVEVVGEIPAGAAQGRTFDVFVTAIDQDTVSLAGGELIPCDLKIYQEVSPARILEGRTLARASGPVFLNPFRSREQSSPGNADLTAGRVIGGGSNLVERKLRLITTVESYATVRRMAEVINRRFESDSKVADPISPASVELRVPPGYRGQEARFLEIVFHLPLITSMVEREARVKALVGELARPDAPLEDVALSLEAMGKSVIPLLQGMYTDDRKAVNYHAARTGVRLGHDLALPVLVRHANDERSPFRGAAIRELGTCPLQRDAGRALRALLESSDIRIRLLAYESLRELDREAVMRFRVGEETLNFWLELAPSRGAGIIYARRTKVRRIGLIGGEEMTCRTPLFYSVDGSPVTLTAEANETRMNVLLRKANKTIGPFKVPLSIPILIRFLGDAPVKDENGGLKGLGLDYAQVLDVLYRLCESGAINAEMRWEEPTVEDLVGPLKPLARPESDL